MDNALSVFKLAANACGTKTGLLPSLYDNIPCGADNVPTIGAVEDVVKLIANVVRILIAISGSLAVILILVAAVYYVTSAGDPGRIKKAKDIIINTTIGLVLIILSYAIVTFIAGGF
jgi:hypothetical protein